MQNLKMIFMTWVSHLCLILVALFFLMIQGFDRPEFFATLGILSPILGLTTGIMSSVVNEYQNFLSLKVPYFFKWFIGGYFLVMCLLIFIKAIGVLITFQETLLFLGCLEFFFCVFMGTVLFTVKKE